MKKNKEEFSIRDLIGLFLPKLWLIVLVSLVLSLALGIYSGFIKEDTFSSTATLMVAKKGTSLSTGDIDVSTEMVERCEVVIFSDKFLSDVCMDINNEAKSEGKDWIVTVSYLKQSITMKQRGETEYFDVTATTTEADKSFAIIKALSDKIESDLPGELPYDKNLITSKITNPAIAPLSANSKHVFRNALIGFAVGAVLCMVAIFVYSIFDVTIRDRKKIEDNFDVPVLGVIPKFVEEGND